MDAARAIQAAVVRLDVALVTVWAYIRAAPWVAAVAAGLWGAAKLKYIRTKRRPRL